MNLKRWTICLVANHKWSKIPYGDHDDAGMFLRCRRCGHEDHGGTSTIATGAPMGY